MKKILSIFLIFITIVSSISINTIAKESNNSENQGEHLIERVPYAKQETNLYCMYACFEMVLKYYGIHISQTEFLYNSGGGYSLGYKPDFKNISQPTFMRPPYMYRCRASVEMCQGQDDFNFTSNIYGCSFKLFYPETKTLNFLEWDQYWEKLKEKLIQDIPVITGIDPCAWPSYKEIHNFSKTPLFSRGAHNIVIVGFNEDNNSVCFNDPYPGFCGIPEEGTYHWVSIKDFKKAARRTYWDLRPESYELLVLENISEPPDKDSIFRLAHQRNIERMRGIKSAYDEKYLNGHFDKFGINALKTLKEDFSSKLITKIAFYKIINKITGLIDPDLTYPFTDIKVWFIDIESKTKHNMSQYLNETKNLLENETLIQICEHDAVLLENESQKYKQLNMFFSDLEENIVNNSLFKAISESKSIVDNIVNVIDEIIEIEEQIIAGPQGGI